MPLVIQPQFLFGLRTGVTNNLFFMDERTVVFPCGNNCVCYNTDTKSQRFIPGSPVSRGIVAMAISSNLQYLAVSECGEKPAITVLDLQQKQNFMKRVLTTRDTHVEEFICMAFSPDTKYLIGQTGAPEWNMILWLWEKQKVLGTIRTTNPNNPVTQVSFNPFNNTHLSVSGNGVFKLFCYSKGTLNQSSLPKVESMNFLCHAWVGPNRVIVGTDIGRLLVLESGDFKSEIESSLEQPDRQAEVEGTDMNKSDAVSRITAIVAYSKGFACSRGLSVVCLYEKTWEDGYRKTREIRIPADYFGDESSSEVGQEISTICFSPSEETLAISTNRGQLYSVCLAVVDVKKVEQLHFQILSQSFHSQAISGLSVSLWKPLVATCSLDHSVRIWNYETKVLELCKEFQENVNSVALHPNGLFILVGFSDKLQLMTLLLDDIHSLKEFDLHSCRECAFSNGGNLFAAVSGNVIQIYSVTSFENIFNLKGHNGKVRGIEWSQDDSQLVSCGMDGAVYEWNIQTGKRVSESILKSCSYTGINYSADCRTVLAVGTDLTLKEIQDSQILREVPVNDVTHTAMAVSHSGRVIFTGTSSGTVMAIKYPLPTQNDWVTYQAHSGPVTKMAITFDDRFLLTASEDSSLCIWKITDKDGKRLKSKKQIIHVEEVLVTKEDLKEKSKTIQELKQRLEDLQMENEYQLRLKNLHYQDKMRELSDKFTQEIEALERTQQVMRKDMEDQQHENQEHSKDITVQHLKQLNALEVSQKKKLTEEYERYQDLQLQCQRMQEDYKEQLKAAADSRRRFIDQLTQQYEARLEDKSNRLDQSWKDAHQQVCEFQELIKQAEEDEERKIHRIQINYEKKLHTEKQTNANLKGETNIMTQKIYGLQKQLDDRGSDITQLNQERHKLLALIRSLESDIEDLKRQISGHEKSHQDKDRTIAGLKKRNQELEKWKFVLDFDLNELKKRAKPQQDSINEKKERIHQLEEELVQMIRSNSHLEIAVSEFKLKMRTKDKELNKEMQRVKNLETHLVRVKSELENCAAVIQDPRKLKDNVRAMHTRFIQHGGALEKSNNDEILEAMRCQREHMENTISSLQKRLAVSYSESEKIYIKNMKENWALHSEVNALRKELNELKSQAKDHKTELEVLRKSSKPSSDLRGKMSNGAQ